MISAQDLAEQEKKKLEIRKATYKAILEHMCRKIKHASELGDKSVFLQVPPFLIGYPAYDHASATDYIQRQLSRLGYQAIKVHQGTLGVTWGDIKVKNTTVVIDHSNDDEPHLPSLANLQKTAARLRGKK